MKGSLTDMRRMLSMMTRAARGEAQDEADSVPDQAFVSEGRSASHLNALNPEILMHDIRAAARRAGMDERDPLSPLITTLTRVIPFLSQLTCDNMREGRTHHERMLETLRTAQQTAQARTEAFQAHIALIESQTVEQVGAAIAQRATDALVRKAAATEWSVLLGLVAMLLMSSIVCGFFGYHQGGLDTAQLVTTDSRLHDAALGDPESADVWVRLMRANNGMKQRLRDCITREGFISDGRVACRLRVFVGVDPRLGPS